MRIDAQQILIEVKENLARIGGCPKHRFHGFAAKFGDRLECSNCGGKMNLLDVGEYIAGYKAAGGDVNDIWPEYETPRQKGDG